MLDGGKDFIELFKMKALHQPLELLESEERDRVGIMKRNSMSKLRVNMDEVIYNNRLTTSSPYPVRTGNPEEAENTIVTSFIKWQLRAE